MIPIGRGQRELIIGDRGTGKTADRRRHDHQPEGHRRHLRLLRHRSAGGQGAWSSWRRCRSTARWTTPSSWPPTPPIRPRCSTSRPTPPRALAEHFMWQGKHTLVVYDDLSKQAQAYRQLSLVLRRPPGREAYPGRRVLPPLAAARAGRQAVRRAGRRIAHRAPDHRDPGRGRVGLHPDQRDLDHRRADLPRARPLLLRRPPGRERGYLGLPRRWCGADQGHEEGRRHACGSTSRSTGSSRRSPSSDPTSTRPPSGSWPAVPRTVEMLKQPQYQPMPVREAGGRRSTP